MSDLVLYFFCGAVGAFVREIVKDGKLHLPEIKDGCVVLGFIGAIIIGGFVGYVVDHSVISASMAGYVGVSAISNLFPIAKNGTKAKDA